MRHQEPSKRFGNVSPHGYAKLTSKMAFNQIFPLIVHSSFSQLTSPHFLSHSYLT